MELESQKVLVSLPVYNEGKRIVGLIKGIRAICDFPILVVNDGSDQFTAAAIKTSEPDHTIEHSHNKGPGAALRTAFNFAKGNSIDILVTIDADCQHDPKCIPTLIDAIEGTDIVTGTRFDPLSEKKTPIPPLRKKANSILAKIVSDFTGYTITDSACGFRVYWKKTLGEFCLTEKGYGWPFQLWVQARNAGLKIREVPIPNIYHEFYRDLDRASFENTINYCIRIIKRECIKCCINEILRFGMPSMELVKLAFARHLPRTNIDLAENTSAILRRS